MTFEQGKDEIAKLVGYFSTNSPAFHAPGFKEAQARQSLIDPFFIALGWDVRNDNHTAPQYLEVIPEETQDDEGHTKSPDYVFRVGQTPKFFTEAKKPAVNIKDDPAPAYQIRRYAWTAKLPLSILTNFEEFAVYKCGSRPSLTDKANKARLWYFTFEEYPDRWREIWDVFSREAVWGGKFDRFTSLEQRGTSTFDAEFLKEIEGWRESLARNLALRNPTLSHEDLNKAVQLTIDRIIFLRMAEDRGIERYERLLKLTERTDIYQRFIRDVCRTADNRYNSGLFHFDKEIGVESEPDNLTPHLVVDDKVLKSILTNLYFPSPYAFRVMPVEILGNIYEQFLGKVIRLTKGHQAKVEEKPEVRKAGGVYYTPAYIVDYILKNTVGMMVDGKSPAQLAGKGVGHPFRLLDLACGSGSFLLGGYQYLLDYCLKWYTENGPEKFKKAVWRSNGQDAWRLTVGERKRILTTHVFGVDIDAQAVEVSKLTLLLKVLEGETDESLGKQTQVKLFDDRALPNLDRNIKWGNSLIGADYFTGRLIAADEEELSRVKPFDWKVAFPEAMQDGGFDCIVGNPPYVLLQDEFRDDGQLQYFRAKYQCASFKLDTYHLFIERSIQLLNPSGRCSMITPANFLTNNHLDRLRRYLLTESAIDHIVVIDGGVFHGISVDNAVFVLHGKTVSSAAFPIHHASSDHGSLVTHNKTAVSPERALNEQHCLFTSGQNTKSNRLWDRLEKSGILLGEIAYVNFGKQLRDRKKFTTDVIKVHGWKRIKPPYRACYTGRDVARYHLEWGGAACLDDEEARCGGCWDASRQNGKNKLITRQIGRHPDFGMDVHGFQCLNTVFMVNLKEAGLDLRFLLGVLNSRLLRAFWLQKFYDQRRTFPKIKGTYLKKLPICRIDLGQTEEETKHQRMTTLVEQMLSLQIALSKADSDQSRDVLRRQIDATDAEIDRLVYDLYGLTEEEIAIVEQATLK